MHSLDVYFTHTEQLGALAFRHAVPAICPYHGFAVAGGLMSYGTNIPKLFREVGDYTSRIPQGREALPISRCSRW